VTGHQAKRKADFVLTGTVSRRIMEMEKTQIKCCKKCKGREYEQAIRKGDNLSLSAEGTTKKTHLVGNRIKQGGVYLAMI